MIRASVLMPIRFTTNAIAERPLSMSRLSVSSRSSICYLQEKGRIPSHLKTAFESKLKAGKSGLVLADLTQGVVDALAKIPRAEVPEMPDRIIAATGLHLGLPVISRDRKIQSSTAVSTWVFRMIPTTGITGINIIKLFPVPPVFPVVCFPEHANENRCIVATIW